MDTLRPIITGLIGGVIAFLVLRAVRRSAERPLTGNELRYGRGMRLMAVAMVAIACFIGYAALHARKDQRLLAYGLSVVLLGGGLWFIIEAFLTKVNFDDDLIQVFSPWRGLRRIPYSAITGYSYSTVNQWHALETRGHGKLRLSIYLEGIHDFGEFLERKLDALDGTG